MNSILIIAHSPFAHALRQCALHVFPDCEHAIVALDVLPNVSPEETLAAARITLEQQLNAPRSQVLVLADVFGATPCNVAQKLVDGVRSRLITGVNLPMVIKLASNTREMSLRELAEEVEAQGREAILRAGMLLEPQKLKKDA
jgi:PTS system ascorbate-specific IIA component